MSHKSHCNQGEYVGGCKYGEAATCPALQGPVGGSEAQEREAFEAWAEKEGFDIERTSFGHYKKLGTNQLYSGWLARATAAAPAAPVRLDGQAQSSWANKDMSVLIAHLREDTNFDAALVEQMLQFAINAAHPPAAVVGQALEALTRIALRSPTDASNYTLASVGDIARAAIAALRAADTKEGQAK